MQRLFLVPAFVQITHFGPCAPLYSPKEITCVESKLLFCVMMLVISIIPGRCWCDLLKFITYAKFILNFCGTWANCFFFLCYRKVNTTVLKNLCIAGGNIVTVYWKYCNCIFFETCMCKLETKSLWVSASSRKGCLAICITVINRGC